MKCCFLLLTIFLPTWTCSTGRAATTLSKTTLQKSGTAMLLPEDVHYSIRDLTKLFCKPAWMVYIREREQRGDGEREKKILTKFKIMIGKYIRNIHTKSCRQLWNPIHLHPMLWMLTNFATMSRPKSWAGSASLMKPWMPVRCDCILCYQIGYLFIARENWEFTCLL